MKKPQKMNLSSMDIAEEKKGRLKEIFPEVFCENKIDFDQLKRVLGEWVETDTERFGLSWPGKADCMKIIQQPSSATLKPVLDESIKFDETENLFIEGDNLEVLKLLQKSYFGKIKTIYIDPPYNTGKEFIYSDKYGESLKTYLDYTMQTDKSGRKLVTNTESDGRYHSNWLNMMYPRLYLARNLLRKDGVIFISIDEHEVANLRELLDVIFGPENHLGTIVVQSNPGGRDYGGIARTHDYLMVYAKSSEAKINELGDTERDFRYKDDRGGFDIRELRNRNISFNKKNRPNLFYPFYLNPHECDRNGFFELSLEKKQGWKTVFPKKSQDVQTVWRWGKEKASRNLNIDLVGKTNKNGGYQIVQKYRKKTRMVRTIWQEREMSTEKGTLQVKNLFGKKLFDFPKPYEMLVKVIEMGSDKDSIILDFFAGSATTAHAVMHLNAKDGGTRKFIMIQFPELTQNRYQKKEKLAARTISQIGKERIRLAAKKISDGQDSVLNLNSIRKIDFGFKSFRLSGSNFKTWQSNADKIDDLKQQILEHADHVDPESTHEDILYEILLKAGFLLTVRIEKTQLANKEVFIIEKNKMIICLDRELDQDVIDAIAEINPQQVICLDEGFRGNDQLKTNTVQTFKTEKDEKEIIFKTI